VFLVRRRHEGVVLPELRTEVSVGGLQGVEHGLNKVTHGTGVTTSGGVTILNSGHVHELLSGGGRDESGSARGGNETHANGSTLSGDLAGHSVRHTSLTSPVSTTDGGYVELGGGDGSTNGGGDLCGALDSETDVAVVVSKGDEGLESGTLSGTGLLLDGHDLHDLILELVLEEVVDDLGFLDGDGEEEDLLEGGDLSVLH